MSKQPTSFRFTEDELELLDALGEYQASKSGIPQGRSGTVRSLLKRIKPPEEQNEAAARLRRAYERVFAGIGR